ncbi:phage tail tube protein [Acinetobacter nosocomialis]|uniref:phage tail tube protein n=1 Tax=Acinetobacter nosocomialis TaxID=106654 RepID=UPI00124FD617|nr:phage tail tube protein [Acinetobacter nosocomialis]
MSSGARQITQIAKETTVGTTPSPFARTTFEFTENTLDATVTKEESKSISSGRLSRSSMITGADFAGEIKFEAKYSQLVQDLMSAAAFNSWSSNVLTFGGSLRQTFTILRGFEDVNDFHVFRGCHVSSFNIDIPEAGLISMSFGIAALGRTNFSAPPTGVITPADNNPKMSNVSVGDILIDGASQAGISCLTAFSLKWDNTMKVQKCLGGGINPGAILETLAGGTGSFTAAWSRNTSNMYEKQFTNATISLKVPITDTLGNSYEIFIPKAEITAKLPSGGNSDILNSSFEYKVVEEDPTITRIPASAQNPNP